MCGRDQAAKLTFIGNPKGGGALVSILKLDIIILVKKQNETKQKQKQNKTRKRVIMVVFQDQKQLPGDKLRVHIVQGCKNVHNWRETMFLINHVRKY